MRRSRDDQEEDQREGGSPIVRRGRRTVVRSITHPHRLSSTEMRWWDAARTDWDRVGHPEVVKEILPPRGMGSAHQSPFVEELRI